MVKLSLYGSKTSFHCDRKYYLTTRLLSHTQSSINASLGDGLVLSFTPVLHKFSDHAHAGQRWPKSIKAKYLYATAELFALDSFLFVQKGQNALLVHHDNVSKERMME